MERLRACYDRLSEYISHHSTFDIEPYESVELVERYRQYWKPDNVRIVLLAESHVLTTNDDRNFTIKKLDRLPGYPAQYAKFVYCLAYGENYFRTWGRAKVTRCICSNNSQMPPFCKA